MSKEREALSVEDTLKMALEDLRALAADLGKFDNEVMSIAAIEEALAQPEQEPVAWIEGNEPILTWVKTEPEATPLYTTPPQRKPLTDEQIEAAVNAWFENDIVDGQRPFSKRMRAAIEAAHGIKE